MLQCRPEVDIVSSLADRLEELLTHPSQKARLSTAEVLMSFTTYSFECGKHMKDKPCPTSLVLRSGEFLASSECLLSGDCK